MQTNSKALKDNGGLSIASIFYLFIQRQLLILVYRRGRKVQSRQPWSGMRRDDNFKHIFNSCKMSLPHYKSHKYKFEPNMPISCSKKSQLHHWHALQHMLGGILTFGTCGYCLAISTQRITCSRGWWTASSLVYSFCSTRTMKPGPAELSLKVAQKSAQRCRQMKWMLWGLQLWRIFSKELIS